MPLKFQKAVPQVTLAVLVTYGAVYLVNCYQNSSHKIQPISYPDELNLMMAKQTKKASKMC